jgi:hypothetical protein
MKADQLIRTIEIKDRNGRVVGTKEVVTYQGLLSKAHEEGLKSIRTRLVQAPTDDNGRTAIAKAAVETEKGQFEALGDASPMNVNSFIVPHLIRMAETRAKARALRDAVNVGVISFEELNGEGIANGADDAGPTRPPGRASAAPVPNGPMPSPEGPGGPEGPAPMSEAQRRYLFRLLASRGMHGDAAHEHVKQLLGVEALSEATKTDATALIDQLLAGEEVPTHGTALR